MKNYATQMEAAKKGIITPEMEVVAKRKYTSRAAYEACSLRSGCYTV